MVRAADYTRGGGTGVTTRSGEGTAVTTTPENTEDLTEAARQSDAAQTSSDFVPDPSGDFPDVESTSSADSTSTATNGGGGGGGNGGGNGGGGTVVEILSGPAGAATQVLPFNMGGGGGGGGLLSNPMGGPSAGGTGMGGSEGQENGSDGSILGGVSPMVLVGLAIAAVVAFVLSEEGGS